MTYCEKATETGEYALHCNEEELGMLMNLVSSLDNKTTNRLRKVIEPWIRSNDRFNLNVSSEFKRCEKCEGAGSIRDWNMRDNYYDKIICPACGGDRVRRVTTTIRYDKVLEPEKIVPVTAMEEG